MRTIPSPTAWVMSCRPAPCWNWLSKPRSPSSRAISRAEAKFAAISAPSASSCGSFVSRCATAISPLRSSSSAPSAPLSSTRPTSCARASSTCSGSSTTLVRRGLADIDPDLDRQNPDPTAIDAEPPLGEQPDRLGQGAVLLAQDTPGERLGVVVLAHLDRALQNDRPGVEPLVDQVDGAAADLDAVGERVGRRLQPAAERRQERRMHVQDPAGERLEHGRAEYQPEASAGDDLGLGPPQSRRQRAVPVGALGE